MRIVSRIRHWRWLHRRLPQPEIRAVPDTHDEDGDPMMVRVDPPTWRDMWAIMRGRYRPKVRIYRQRGLTKAGRIMRDLYSRAFTESRSPLLDDIEKGRGAP